MFFIEITQNNKSAVVGCFYRPPNTDISMFSAKMNEVLEILESEKKEIYLLGDLNINLFNYDYHGKTK